jgi:hypothetical protein
MGTKVYLPRLFAIQCEVHGSPVWQLERRTCIEEVEVTAYNQRQVQGYLLTTTNNCKILVVQKKPVRGPTTTFFYLREDSLQAKNTSKPNAGFDLDLLLPATLN